MALPNAVNEQISFLFKDAGDSVFHIAGTGLAALNVDTVDNEQHAWGNDVTSFPVEGLKDIGDNIKQKPDEITVSCFISNDPISGLVDEVTNFADRMLNGRNRTKQAFDQLLALRNLKVPVKVVTRYRIYNAVAITAVTLTRKPEDGESITFDVSFRELNIVKTQTTKVPAGLGAAGSQSDTATKQRAGVKTDAGKSTGKHVDVKKNNPPQSLLKQIGGQLSSYYGKK